MSNKQGAAPTNPKAGASKQRRPTQAILNTNRKTELCRNWKTGTCSYGERCAFAHGEKELKYRTLREMESAGRIPDASKYRSFPCMTWVATGSCPYSSRCAFIHDPRVSSPREAWLRADCQATSMISPASNDNFFFFPDMVRDPDTVELPTHALLYELDSQMGTTENLLNRAVYHIWYSFVSILTEDDKKKGTGNSDMDNVANSSAYTKQSISQGHNAGDNAAGTSAAAARKSLSGAHQPSDDTIHLPTFLGLLKGVSTRPMTPTSPMLPIDATSESGWVLDPCWDNVHQTGFGHLDMACDRPSKRAPPGLTGTSGATLDSFFPSPAHHPASPTNDRDDDMMSFRSLPAVDLPPGHRQRQQHGYYEAPPLLQ